MIRSAASLLLVLAAACGGGAKSSSGGTSTPKQDADPIRKTAGPECGIVAEKLSVVVEADQPDAQAQARATIVSRCSDDKWSDEARSCFATVETDAEVDGCKAQLSAEQRAKWTTPSASPTAPAAAAPAPVPADASAKKKQPAGTRSADPEEGGE